MPGYKGEKYNERVRLIHKINGVLGAITDIFVVGSINKTGCR